MSRFPNHALTKFVNAYLGGPDGRNADRIATVDFDVGRVAVVLADWIDAGRLIEVVRDRQVTSFVQRVRELPAGLTTGERNAQLLMSRSRRSGHAGGAARKLPTSDEHRIMVAADSAADPDPDVGTDNDSEEEAQDARVVVENRTRVLAGTQVSSGGVWRSYRRADEEAEPSEAEWSRPDPQKIRAAVRGHARLQNSIADVLLAAGLEPLSPAGEPEFDVAWRRQDGRLVMCEVKSTNPDTIESQMRAAVAQALRYQAQLEQRLTEPVMAAIFVEQEPDEIWQSLCRRLAIVLAWPPNVQALV